MADAEPPELGTTDDWRGIMERARKAHLVDGKPMTQAELATRVTRRLRELYPASTDTPSQVAISKIESGQTKSSKLVTLICDVLHIPPPVHDEQDRDWMRLGRVLRSGDLDEYRHLVAMLQKLASKIEAPEVETPAGTEATAPKPK